MIFFVLIALSAAAGGAWYVSAKIRKRRAMSARRVLESMLASDKAWGSKAVRDALDDFEAEVQEAYREQAELRFWALDDAVRDLLFEDLVVVERSDRPVKGDPFAHLDTEIALMSEGLDSYDDRYAALLAQAIRTAAYRLHTQKKISMEQAQQWFAASGQIDPDRIDSRPAV